jgi:hypothetical protein
MQNAVRIRFAQFRGIRKITPPPLFIIAPGATSRNRSLNFNPEDTPALTLFQINPIDELERPGEN